MPESFRVPARVPMQDFVLTRTRHFARRRFMIQWRYLKRGISTTHEPLVIVEGPQKAESLAACIIAARGARRVCRVEQQFGARALIVSRISDGFDNSIVDLRSGLILER